MKDKKLVSLLFAAAGITLLITSIISYNDGDTKKFLLQAVISVLFCVDAVINYKKYRKDSIK